ncbi:hypothetical protein BRE01_34940 [Brevibacillus reuszeri]|uniref:Uncharacterized protein n=1 Tax=Brevibacillus reuszeri TaxID=54915 RepID=A0A0K9YQ03_9BACL|nr:hypothetical protein [Brevibacillus reuszeri]KNB70732.1 hypothetical protein ADS79_17840 [Brevibacillus reuszeri]MED1861251.1 hypothetical protein [Brevibacillus reuszeri]GED69792.1 hypothetical protein BRE01_34940 [Brevibacillus reuszeri]
MNMETRLSTNPSMLARDLRVLEDGGYRTEKVQPVSMHQRSGATGSNRLIPDGSSWKMSFTCYLNEVQDERDRLQSFTGESVFFHATKFE